MEIQKPDLTPSSLNMLPIKDLLLKQCKVMIDYSLKVGKTIESEQVLPLSKADDQVNATELIPVFNYLAGLVKPALPGTLILFEKNRQSNSIFKSLGPLPIVRWFMLISILSLLALILTSLFTSVNTQAMQESMLQGGGLPQMERLSFLLAAASVGASFYALFKMNSFIQKGTFDLKYASTYWSRFVLGLVAGVLLSELFVGFIGTAPATGSGTAESPLPSSSMMKPILAILGGFSANLLYRILTRLIDTVESLFKGTTEELLANKEQQMTMENTLNESRLKNASAVNLLSLKQKLIDSKVSQSVLNEIDTSLANLISTPMPKVPIPDTEGK